MKERNYDGNTILADWLRPQRQQAEAVAVQRFETPPGLQAQADWGHLGSLSEDGRGRKLWGFTMTLGYSRGMFAAAATDQKCPARRGRRDSSRRLRLYRISPPLPPPVAAAVHLGASARICAHFPLGAFCATTAPFLEDFSRITVARYASAKSVLSSSHKGR